MHFQCRQDRTTLLITRVHMKSQHQLRMVFMPNSRGSVLEAYLLTKSCKKNAILPNWSALTWVYSVVAKIKVQNMTWHATTCKIPLSARSIRYQRANGSRGLRIWSGCTIRNVHWSPICVAPTPIASRTRNITRLWCLFWVHPCFSLWLLVLSLHYAKLL